MEYLFDLDKPHFAAWLQLHDIDIDPDAKSILYEFTPILKSTATPLYYTALCRFQDLAEQLIVKHPQHVCTIGGYFIKPTLAAMGGENILLTQPLPLFGFFVGPQSKFKKKMFYF